MIAHLLDPLHELHSRVNDGIHHPYAYAAWHGIATRPALPELVRT